jgi:hypothetical protein
VARLDKVKAQLLLVADPATSRSTLSGWVDRYDLDPRGQRVWAPHKRVWISQPGWIGVCGCTVTVANSNPVGDDRYTAGRRIGCRQCGKVMEEAPYQQGLLTAYLMGGWPAVVELAISLYVDLP